MCWCTPNLRTPHCGKLTCVPPAGQSLGLVKINGHSYIKPVMTVAKVTVDGATCVVPLADLMDVIGDGGEYTVRVETMRVAEFARMAEFTGW